MPDVSLSLLNSGTDFSLQRLGTSFRLHTLQKVVVGWVLRCKWSSLLRYRHTQPVDRDQGRREGSRSPAGSLREGGEGSPKARRRRLRPVSLRTTRSTNCTLQGRVLHTAVSMPRIDILVLAAVLLLASSAEGAAPVIDTYVKEYMDGCRGSERTEEERKRGERREERKKKRRRGTR